MKTIIYFIRHGEVYNPKSVLYGRLSRFPLSHAGKEKIKEIGEYFARQKIDLIYASPLLRARQTAEILAGELNIPIIISRRLMEIRHLFQGMNLDLYREKYQPNLYHLDNIRKGQESIEEISRRMLNFVKTIENRHKGKKVIAVSHGDPILILKTHLTNTSFTWEYKRKNYLKTGDWSTLVCREGKYTWD